MKLLAALLALSAIPQGVPAPPRQPEPASDPCPAETPRSRGNLAQFLTSPAFAEDRRRLGLDKLAPGHLQRLAGEADAEVCRRLDATFASSRYGRSPYRRTYYKAAGLYFVTITQQPGPGEGLVLGHAPHVIVFNDRLEPLNY